MNQNRLGCLSPIAMVASAITLLVIIGFAITSGSGFFSPGALNAQAGENIGGVTSHAAIGNDCSRCHSAPWETATLADRCQSCHTEITSQLGDPNSLHSTMLKGSPITCRGCHNEHRGPNAALTELQTGNFPHEKTGYSLKSHQRHGDGLLFTCTDCHGEDISRFNPPTCSNCHQKLDSGFMSAHIKSYGPTCQSCHDGIETIGKNFDHNQTGFKLEGEHAELTCAQCHQNTHTAADFKNAATDCSSCHLKDDAHKGQFGKECGTCHQSNAWEPATFDHNRTNFKLTGKHAQAKCDDCHANKVFKGTPSTCVDCHQKDDEHKGAFGQDCNACHATNAWQPATFDHNLSAFKLDGAHAKVACNDCHVNNVFKGTPTQCASCHQNPAFHAGLFVGTACSTCHNTRSWVPALYNGAHPGIADEGGRGVNHGGAGCRSCHTVNLSTATCTQCHDSNKPGD